MEIEPIRQLLGCSKVRFDAFFYKFTDPAISLQHIQIVSKLIRNKIMIVNPKLLINKYNAESLKI